MNIFFYIIIVFISLLLISIAFIRMKYKFWVLQPVFHIYDFQYYLFPPGVINYAYPDINKYCNLKDIEFINSDDISDVKLYEFQKLIRKNYLQNRDNKFEPKKENIKPYFEGHNAACFFSFYYEPELISDLKKGTTIESAKLIGAMTTRPLHVSINNGCKDAFFDVYYVDHLCVDKNKRKMGIAPQIIQTHEYHQRRSNKKVKVSLFKREDELTGIVPLCVYNTYGFDMSNWLKPLDLMPNISLIECGTTNIHILFDFMRENNKKFDILILNEISNLLQLIKTKNIYAFFIIIDGDVKCAYFFRKTCTNIENDKEALSCFASINATNNNEIFIHGYKVALWKIHEREKTFGFAVLEDISNNNVIINNLKIKTSPLIISPTAYFFYNFAYPTFKSSRVLIIC